MAALITTTTTYLLLWGLGDDDDDDNDDYDQNISFNLLMNEHYIGSRYILPLPLSVEKLGSQLRER